MSVRIGRIASRIARGDGEGFVGLVGVVTDLGEADRLAGFICSETERAGKRCVPPAKSAASMPYERLNLKQEKPIKVFGATTTRKQLLKNKKKETSFWKDLSPKAYFVGSLVIVLLLVGLFTYFKK